MNPSTIYLCENQPILVEGLRAVLARTQEFALVGSASELGLAWNEIQTIRPDILLVGQAHTMKSMMPAVVDLRDWRSSCRVVLWAGEISEMDAFRALQLGVRGIIRKVQPVEVFLECLRAVSHGEVWVENAVRDQYGASRRQGAPRITRREREIVEYVCRGMKNKEIAEALSITPGTVKVHLMHIFEKTGVKDRFQLALQGPHLLGLADQRDERGSANSV